MKPVFQKVCPVCKEKFTTTVRHQRYCTDVCRVTHEYNERFAVTPMKRAPQWFLDKRLGGLRNGAQDDIQLESIRQVLKEEVQKIRDAGLKIDLSTVEMHTIRLHSARRNWGLCYGPWHRDRVIGGVLLPKGKYCFAFNRRLFSHATYTWRQTLMHELLHVVAGQNYGKYGRGHGKVFQALCHKINLKYGYHISHYTSERDMETYDKAACSM